jgi:hypothetical protein
MQHLEDKNSDLSTDGAVGVARDFLVRFFSIFLEFKICFWKSATCLAILRTRSWLPELFLIGLLQVKMAQPLSEDEKQQQVRTVYLTLQN